MQELIKIRDGLISNLLVIAFLLALSAFAFSFVLRDRNATGYIMVLFGIGWLLSCYFPLHSILKPKACHMFIDAKQLSWVVADDDEQKQETRIPLNSIKELELVFPVVTGSIHSKRQHLAQVFVVTKQGISHEVPSDLYPGVYWNRIVNGIKLHVPNVLISERRETKDVS